MRQGDPLSPLLFALVMREVTDAITSAPFHTKRLAVRYLAYADDLVLLAPAEHHVASGLQQLAVQLELAGLSLNPRKSRVLRIAASSRLKTAACDERGLSFRGQVIPGTGPSEIFKLLGVRFKWNGLVKENHLAGFNSDLQEISAAPLKPQQRIDLLHTFTVPRYLHQLVLGTVHNNTLRNIAIRRAGRLWLRFPSDVSTAFLYTLIREGLGFHAFARRWSSPRLGGSNDSNPPPGHSSEQLRTGS